MGRISIFFLVVSTVVLLVTFGQGIGVIQGGDVKTHLSWAMATLVIVLGANFMAMIHGAQSDRLIRELRRQLAARDGESMDSSRERGYRSGSSEGAS
jgi:hypothetical protein